MVGILLGIDDPDMDVDCYVVVPPPSPPSTTHTCDRDELRTADRLWRAMASASPATASLWPRITSRVGKLVSNMHDFERGNVETRHRKVQIVHRIYSSVPQVVWGFDIDVCQTVFDGTTVWATPDACRALASGFMVYDIYSLSHSCDFRYAKYMARYGLGVLCVGVPQVRLDRAFVTRLPMEAQEEETQEDASSTKTQDHRQELRLLLGGIYDRMDDVSRARLVERLSSCIRIREEIGQRLCRSVFEHLVDPPSDVCPDLGSDKQLARCVSSLNPGYARLFCAVIHARMGILHQMYSSAYDESTMKDIYDSYGVPAAGGSLQDTFAHHPGPASWSFARDSIVSDDYGRRYYSGAFVPMTFVDAYAHVKM